MDYQCDEAGPTGPGQSEIGNTPLSKGAHGWITHLDNFLGTHLHFIGTGLGVITTLALSPVALFAWITRFVGVLFGWILTPIFFICDLCVGSNVLVSPVLLACASLLLVIRVAYLPIYKRKIRADARLEALKPHIAHMREKYRRDRGEMQRQIMRIQQERRFNPLATVVPVMFIALFLSGFYSLLRNLTTRSTFGTFSPSHVSDSSSLFHYLNSTTSIDSLHMNLTLAVPQVGPCGLLEPYLIACGVFLGLQTFLLRHAFKTRWRIALSVLLLAAGAAVTLPIFFVLLRVVDSLYLITQDRFIAHYKMRTYREEWLAES